MSRQELVAQLINTTQLEIILEQNKAEIIADMKRLNPTNEKLGEELTTEAFVEKLTKETIKKSIDVITNSNITDVELEELVQFFKTSVAGSKWQAYRKDLAKVLNESNAILSDELNSLFAYQLNTKIFKLLAYAIHKLVPNVKGEEIPSLAMNLLMDNPFNLQAYKKPSDEFVQETLTQLNKHPDKKLRVYKFTNAPLCAAQSQMWVE